MCVCEREREREREREEWLKESLGSEETWVNEEINEETEKGEGWHGGKKK